MRNAFIEELTKLAETYDNIALVVGDLGYSVIEAFADRFPDRFINAGVAEQNMTGLAAGMAFPTTLALITALWSGAERTKAIMSSLTPSPISRPSAAPSRSAMMSTIIACP